MKCPNCGRFVPDYEAGKIIACPGCGRTADLRAAGDLIAPIKSTRPTGVIAYFQIVGALSILIGIVGGVISGASHGGEVPFMIFLSGLALGTAHLAIAAILDLLASIADRLAAMQAQASEIAAEAERQRAMALRSLRPSQQMPAAKK